MATRLPIADVNAVLKAYYGNGYIGNKEIKEIFGTTASSTVWKLKKAVREEEKKREIPTVVPRQVSVRVAFDVWKIDVKEIERNRRKLIELNLA